MRKAVKNLLKYNGKSLIQFEVIYKLLSTMVFVPLFLSLFQWITKIRGYSYLTFENLFSFILHPVTLFFLFFLLLFLTFYTILDISTILIFFDCSYQKKKITVKEAFFLACQRSVRVFRRKNFWLPFLVLFLIPFLNLGISSGFVSTISIPEFILEFIFKNSFLSCLYILVIFFLSILLFRWLYVLPYFVLENCDFKEACRRSANLSKKNKLKDFGWILFLQLFLVFGYLIFLFLGIFFISILYFWLGKHNLFGTLSITMIWLFIALSFAIMILLSTPFSYAIICARFYYHKETRKEKIQLISFREKERKQSRRMWKVLPYVVAIFLLGSGTLFTYSVMNGKYDMNIEYVRTMEVTAHRGASVSYPENTMRAFEGAKELGADWIELDVQQTKDRQLIVLHDTNFKRTTGVDKNTWELSYDEVKKLDAGSFFGKEFQGERIPLLEEVIIFAKKNHVKLNIELKPTGHEKDFEKSVVSLIKEYDFSHDCVITSQVYEVLEKVKKEDSTIQTVYVTSFAYGNIIELEAADSFSVEASSVTQTLVSRIHNSGKEVYAWTVNTQESIGKMIDCHVDNIITDNIPLAKDTIYSSKTSNLVQEYIRLIGNLLK